MIVWISALDIIHIKINSLVYFKSKLMYNIVMQSGL